MKSKNVLGHMSLKKESVRNRVRKWKILPKLLCLIVAILVWLLVVNLADVDITEFAFFKVAPRYIRS